jgi:hypothetical protein
MGTKRIVLLLFLVMMMVATVACGPRTIPPAEVEAEEGELVVQLPAIYLDVTDEGQITLAEGPLNETLAALGVDLSNLSMSADTVADLTGAGIESLQLDNQPDGLHIFVNGEAMPTVAWDEASLASLVNVLGIVGADLGEAAKLLPLLPDLGFGVVLRFGNPDARIATNQRVDATAAAQNTLEAAVAAGAALDLSLTYAEDGTFQLQGLNPFMMGMIPADALQQSPDTIASVTEMGIDSLSIMARPTGLVIMINGEPLPYLRSTDEAQLLRTINLLLQVVAPDQAGQMGGIIQQILPALWRQGLRLTVNFPGA